MKKCKNGGCVFWKDDECTHDVEGVVCYGHMPPKTNGDRIRSMSDEELAYYHDRLFADLARCDICCPAVDFCSQGGVSCSIAIFNWLKQEEA